MPWGVPRVEVIVERGELYPTRAHDDDAGFDLVVAEAVRIQPGEFVDIPSGVRVSMPDTIWARIVGRSSTLRKRGLLVVEGIIDAGYQGDLFSGVYNLGDAPVFLKPGDRVAQLIFQPLVAPKLKTVLEFSQETMRGSKGFGSTGG